jgi:hypothetical protein
MSALPFNTAEIQQQATRFRSSVSEALMQRMGGLLNYLRASILPIGSYVHSGLTEAQFQGLTSNNWVLADGRSCAGSDYALLTGNSTVPNAMGVFLRGKNNGRSTATGDSAGEQALGTYEADQFAAHTHTVGATLLTATGGDIATDNGSELARPDVFNTGSTGTGTETRPRALVTNIFFRIN